MRTPSSPSVISISAIPDSSSSSMSFLTLRISIESLRGEMLYCRAQPQVVTQSAEAGDGPDGNIRQQRAVAKFFACLDVAEMHLDKWQAHCEEGVA